MSMAEQQRRETRHTAEGAEALLKRLVEATAPITGERFFHALVRNLAQVLQVKYAFVTECVDHPATRLRTLAFWLGERYGENVEYDLQATPCRQVVNEARECCYPRGVSELFPVERELGAESYRGIPIFNALGDRVIGHIAFLDSRPMPEDDIGWSLARLFAVRAGAEIERMRADRALRESEERYRLVVENQTDVVLKLDADGRILFASPSYREILRRALPQVGDPNPLEVHEDDREATARAWMALSRPPHMSEVEHRVDTPHGWRWIAWSSRAMVGSDGRIQAIVSTGRDITRRKEAEARASLHLERLARLSRASALGAMGTALAHELNQPLASLSNYAQACRRMLEGLPVESADLRDALERIAVNAGRAGEIVRNMRELLEQRVPERRLMMVNEAVREAARLASAAARAARVRLRLVLEEDLPPVLANAVQIQQVVLNLVANAVEAIRDADSAVRDVCLGTSRRGAEALQVAVQDTGPGIPPDAHGRLFEPFFTSKEGGLGMGLCICKSIAEAHGGRIEVGAAESGGALVCLVLPAAYG